jgi:hypothetical protein
MMRGLHDVQYKYLKRIAKHFGTTVKGLVAEYEDDPFREEPTLHRRAADTGNMVTLSEHQIMVTRFKDKARGQHLNTLLLEIEELDPGELDEVAETLQAKLRKLRKRRSPSLPLKDGSSTS